jgi:hypothetical protein
MSGSAHQRLCQTCNKHVRNFAAMTPGEIVSAIETSQGRLCARIMRRSDGSLVTLEGSEPISYAARAAGLALGLALATGAAQARTSASEGKAFVHGTFTGPKGDAPASGSQVVFVADGKSVLAADTDAHGNWNAQLDPGTYDVIFRSGPLFGERVNTVQLHAGEQSFSEIRGRFAYGRLGLEDNPEQYTTVGEMIASYKYPVSYFFRHPIRYLKHLPHNFS